MKILYAILLLLLSSVVFAQADFAPSGAVWYNYHHDGYFRTVYTYDTVIDGITAKVLKRETHVNSGSWASNFPPLYIYSTTDTVFVFNTAFNRFTPLYIFNLSDGDTVRIPGFFAPYSTTTDTVMQYVADSVRIVQYDTSWLRTVYTRVIVDSTVPLPDSYLLSTYGSIFDAYGVYAERIGCLHNGIYPNCLNCAIIPEDCGCIGSLSCYSDPGYDIKLVTGPCEHIVSVTDAADSIQRPHVFPNPADEIINIQGIKQGSTVYLLSADGRPLINIPAINNMAGIPVNKLPSGYYLLQVVSSGGTRNMQSVTISH